MFDRLQYWKDRLAIASRGQKLALLIGPAILLVILLLLDLLPSGKPNPSGWQTYFNEGYSFKYPQNWKTEQTRVMNNGSSVFVRPASLTNGELYPQVIIEKVPSSEITLKTRRDGFLRLGFSETPSILGSVSVSKFTATIPFKISGNTITNQPTYSSLMVFEDKGNLYTVGYEIDKSQLGGSNEKLMSAILSTFILSH